MWFSLLFLLLFFLSKPIRQRRRSGEEIEGLSEWDPWDQEGFWGGEDEEERGSQCLVAVLDSTEKALAENFFLGIFSL